MKKYKIIIILLLSSLIVYLYLKECVVLGGGYYFYDDGAPIVSIEYDKNTVIDCEVIDCVHNCNYILVYRVINENFSRSIDSDNEYINKYKTDKQFFIIEKKTNYIYGPLTYEQYSLKRLELSIPLRLELDTTKQKYN